MEKFYEKNVLASAKSIIQSTILIFLSLFALFSCTKELSQIKSEEPLSESGRQFMQIIKSSDQWEVHWNEIRNVGVPKPNDVIFSIFSRDGACCAIPILSGDNEDIRAFVFYRLKPLEGGGMVVDSSPEIVLRDEIDNDLRSRLLIKSKSFDNWIKRGYSFSTELTQFDYKQYLNNRTKLYIHGEPTDNIYYFDYIIYYTYNSSSDLSRIYRDIENIIMYRKVYYPDPDIEYMVTTNLSQTYFELEYTYVTSKHSSNVKALAEYYFYSVERNLRFIPGVNGVDFMYYGSAGGSSSGEQPDWPESEICPHSKCVCGKFIESRFRYNYCMNDHDYCPNNGKCTIDIKLNVSKEKVEMGEKFRITLDVLPEDAPCSEISFWIVSPKGYLFKISKESATESFVIPTARFPGMYYIYAEFTDGVKYATVESEVTEIEFLAPHVDVLKNQSVFVNNLMPLWNKTLAAASATGYQEFGGVLMVNTTSDPFSYTFEEKVGPFVSYNTNPYVDLTYDYDESADPLIGGDLGVIVFHTHPPLNKYLGGDTLYRYTGPSESDINTHIDIPAAVYDFNMLKHTSKDTSLSDPKLTIYGQKRATYMYIKN